MTTLAQILGVLLLVLAGWLLWSAWAFVIGGVLLLVVPELAATHRARP